jgi:hypothetical protein
MIITKVTLGFVTQRFDTETRRFVDQSFIAEDGHTWEDENGETLDESDDKVAEAIYGLGGVDEPSLPLEMVQPKPELANYSLGDRVFVTPAKDGSDPTEEFQGVVVGFRASRFIQVRDQEDNVFDCDPDQVQVVK